MWGGGLRQDDLAAQRKALVTCRLKRMMVPSTPGVLPWPYPSLGQTYPTSAFSRECWVAVGVLSGDVGWGKIIWQLKGKHLSLTEQRGEWSLPIQVFSLDLIPALARPNPLQPPLGSVGVLWVCSVGRWAEARWSGSSEESTCHLQIKEADGPFHSRCPPLTLSQPWSDLPHFSLF